jgi:hypothetical protein
MRKLAIALGMTAAVVFAGSLAWKADATTLSSGAIHLPSAAKNYSPVEKTGCRRPRLVRIALGAAHCVAGVYPAGNLTLIGANASFEAATIGGLLHFRGQPSRRAPLFGLVRALNFNTFRER